MNNWTDAQLSAINSRDGTILVSAAAGSGKTTVLVQRIIERITDKSHPTPIENLLVVTYTKSAAAEMKDRLSKKLGELIDKEPSNSFLRRQKMFLPGARICTMDSFCGKLVRENFENLDVSPDFTTMSDSEHEILKRDIAVRVLDELYNDGTEETASLLDLFTNGKNDENLIGSILKIYDFSMASLYPEEWLSERFECYSGDESPENSVWGEYALSALRKILVYILQKANGILNDLPEGGKVSAVASSNLSYVKNSVDFIIDMIDGGVEWDEIKNALNSLKLPPFGRFKADEKDDLYFEIKERCDTFKSDFKKANDLMVCFSDEFSDDLQYLRPIMNAFKNVVVNFADKLYAEKKERNTYYFSDILHMALSLLITKNEKGETARTQLAEELKDTYDEILIDEFQDTNEAQNELFEAISKDGKNKFMVGDIKQSIYRFRQAMPEIFISYKNKFEDFKGNNYPAKISLDCNFRSRRGIVDSVNYFFDLLMSREMGDIEYKNGEQLTFGSDYSEHSQADTEVHIVKSEAPLISNTQNEARYIGKLINDMISGGMTVGRAGEERPVKYKDICILLRAAKSQAPVYAGELEDMGIPVHYKKNGGFFDNAEIITVISMLRVVDNPVQDVPLMSVMLSPMFPFAEDDLANMRCNNRSASLYTLLKENYENDGKVRYFLDTVSLLRTLSVTLTVSGLIRRIFEITSYDSVVSAMPNGDKRVLNLGMLINYADMYEQSGKRGLSGFIRYVDKLKKNNFDLESANDISENDDVVKIMTIHKSKGLEFPVVILANCSGKFSKDNDSKALINKDMGVAALRYDSDGHREFDTQPFVSIKHKNESEELSETMRVLYVAMTRAKEKLLLVGSLYSPETAIKKLYSSFYTADKNLSVPLSFCNSFMQWILIAMLYHPTMKELLKSNGVLNCKSENTPAKIKLIIADTPETAGKADEKPKEENPDSDIYNLIDEKISYEYKYSSLAGIPVKYTATSLNREADNQYLASENPAFMGKDELTPAQRGVFTHKFMEICDLDNAFRSVRDEIENLKSKGVFTNEQAEAININYLERFFKSKIAGRIASADRFLREIQFTMAVPVSLVAETELYSDEEAVIQGVMDGIIVNGEDAEIIDYKTDKVSCEEELCERYKQQMYVYKLAAENCFGFKNVKVTLYSLYMGKEIEVGF